MKLNLASLAASIVMLMSTFTMGCGADCESTCEKAQEEGCGHMWTKLESLDPDTPPRAVGDCSSLCEDMEAKTEAAGCTSKHDEYISCLNDQHSVCELEPCSSESIRLTVCMLPH
ncbi:hypothetical protein [Sorangium sp. So ce1182]|uniref:hypothetical protein n=1 Tax=Sorangium sp. So ce1182 TaxID=3133334 RepID=UPI003F5EDC3F